MDDNTKKRIDDVVDQIKELVKKGNIARIMLTHENNVILNIPLNVGIVGTVLGLTAAPWTLIATAIATLGFDCRIELEKTDGEIIEIFSRDVGAAVVNEVKDSFHKDEK